MTQHEIYMKKIVTLAEKYRNKTAITYMREDGKRTTTSYGEILEGCEKVKEILDSVGVVAGDRVAIISPHSPQAVLASIGLAYANVQTVLIDASLPGSEINRLLAFADVRGLFVTKKIYSMITKCNRESIPVLELCECEREYKLFNESVKKVQKEVTTDPETDVIAILFSSGTTAQMKGIKITYNSVMKASDIFIRNVKWRAEYKYLHVFPLNHIAGYATVHAFFSCGSELGMIENMNSGKLLDALLEYEPDGFGMIPKVFEMMEDKIRENIRQKGRIIEVIINCLLNFSGCMRKTFGWNIGKGIFPFVTRKVFGKNIKIIGTGASLCRASTSKFFIDLGLGWANFYASTETNVPAVSTGIFERYPVLMAGNIKRNPEIEIRIHNPDEAGIGEIYIKSELLMKGYFRDEELTKKSYDGEFFKTGDYGYVDDKSNLYITGRVKEAILLHNGKKVSPTDIENYYKKKVCGIEMACCGCVKENTGYDEVYMYIQTADMETEKVVDIIRILRETSAQANDLYKLNHIKTIEKLPLTSVGKVKRFELQKCAMMEQECLPEEKSQEVLYEDDEQIVIQLVRKILGREGEISLEQKLKEDLGFDSLGIFELQTELEINYKRKMLLDWPRILTVGDLADNVKKKKDIMAKRYDMENEWYLKNRSHKDIQKVKHLIWILNRICCVKYAGLENLVEQPCIFAANHGSHLDIMCIYKAITLRYGYDKINKMCCLAAKELVQQKGMAKIFQALGAIPVERRKNAAIALMTLNKYIGEKSYSAVVFPEGTRTRNGKIGRFTNGVASSAISTNVPIIPIGIMGSYDIWPAMKKNPCFSFKKKTVMVNVGAPIYPKNTNVAELTDEIKQEITRLCREM